MAGTGTKFAIGVSVCLAVFVAGLAASTYGLGREEGDKSSEAYQTASVFTTISASGIVIGFVLLIIAILRMCAESESVATALSYPSRMSSVSAQSLLDQGA